MDEPTVRLRPIIEADLPNYVRWFNDPEVTEWLARDTGITLEEEREWFAALSSREFPEAVAIEVDGRHVGGTGLHLHDDDATAGFGIFIGEKSCWGRGYGTAGTREILRIGFEERKLHRIELETWAHNVRAQRCYRKCGFRHEGVRRQARLKRGRWIDVVMMAVLREEWEADGKPSPFRDRGSAAITEPRSIGAREGRVDGDAVHPHLNPPPERGRRKQGEVTIRGYRPADYEQVADLWRAVGSSIRSGDTAQALDSKTAHDPSLVLVAESGGRIVGTAFGAWDGRRAFINRVAVDPAYQRRGIGTPLMGQVERRLAALGAQRVGLLTGGERRSEAVRFYESLGYEVRDDVRYLSKDLGSEP